MSEITYNNDVIYNGDGSPVTLKTRNKVMISDVVVESNPTAGLCEFTVINEKPDADIFYNYGSPSTCVDVIDGKIVTTSPPGFSNHGFIIPWINDDVGERYKFMNLMVDDPEHEVDIIYFVDDVEYVAPYNNNYHFIIINSDTYYHTFRIYIREHPTA